MNEQEFLGMLVFALITLVGFIHTIKKVWLDPRQEIMISQIESRNENTKAIINLANKMDILTVQIDNQHGIINEVKEQQSNHSKRIGKLETTVAVLSNIEKRN